MHSMHVSIFKSVKFSLLLSISVAICSIAGNGQSVHREKINISVGPTVQVSGALGQTPHYENLAVGDPRHQGRLITCSMVYPDEPGKLCDQDCYVSFDSGKTWQPSLKVTEGMVNGDPTEVYGQGDNVYVVALVIKDLDQPKDPDPDAPQDVAKTVVYKSTDGGKTFAEATRFKFIDREFIGLDTTNGKYAGRLYIVGQSSVRGIMANRSPGLQLFHSSDDGKTFMGPVFAEYPEGTEIAGVATGAVLSDGTFVTMFGLTKKGRAQGLEAEPSAGPNGELHVISTRDGGETFTRSQKICDWKVDRPRSEGGMLGQLAVDPGSKAFKDRLYAVFPEIVEDRIQIRLSSSADKGKTWSKPVTINDDRSPAKGGNGPDHLLPSVAVNQDGVVMVTWYDRREAKDNIGWRLRAAVSLDGGETFSASVPVTEFANSYPETTAWDIRGGGQGDDKNSILSVFIGVDSFFVSGGHTSGLAVDADGTFHPTWIDNHTGVAQLWSASLKVPGTPMAHGGADLSELEDVSGMVKLQMSRPVFDRKTGLITAKAQLKNISKDPIRGPVKVRVLTLESEMGVPEITNADNGLTGTGAIWDFSQQVSGDLTSMKVSEPKTLTFKVSDLRPLGQGKDFKYSFLNLDARVLAKLPNGKSEKAKSDKDKAAGDFDDDGDGDREPWRPHPGQHQ